MVSQRKIDLVQQMAGEIQRSPVIGLANLENLPASQLQKMRAVLKRNGVEIRTARKRLLILALSQVKKEGLSLLVEKITGIPALIFTKENPFLLYATLQKSKSEAPAKAGQRAPREIMVKAGPTNFAPGPIISELAAVGIKTKVDAGKLAILADTIVAKEGDVISRKLAETLKRLDIKPMEIGLNLVVVWENGLVFNARQLHLDEAEYARNISDAARWAFNLALECAYVTAETTEALLQKAFREAKAAAIEAAILTAETQEEILARSASEAEAVKKEANL